LNGRRSGAVGEGGGFETIGTKDFNEMNQVLHTRSLVRCSSLYGLVKGTFVILLDKKGQENKGSDYKENCKDFVAGMKSHSGILLCYC
jgi:hypothetical protein